MSNPFVAEIRLFPGNFAPVGWAQCDGQILPISQNTALFSLLGTTYGGDGKSTFALPNFQGAAPLQPGQGPGLSQYDLGQTGGVTAVTLLASEMPAHTHAVQCNNGSGDVNTPSNNTWCKSHTGKTPLSMYASTSNATMSPSAVSIAGGSQPHNNMPPYLVLNFIIALQGVYPSRG